MVCTHREQDEPIIIPVEDSLVHTPTSPFCSDPTCPCHEDATLQADVYDAVQGGLLTPDEATRVVQGKQIS